MFSRLINLAQDAADRICDLKKYEAADTTKPRLIAHRGAWGEATHIENTILAITRAGELGAWGVELDLRFTKDNVAVINHDPDLRRCHACDEKIADVTFKELRKLAPNLPMLEDVLSVRNFHLMLEVKTVLTSVQQQVLTRQLMSLKPTQDYHLLALHPELIKIHSALPEASWVLVGELNLGRLIKISVERGYCGVAGHYLGMTKDCVDQLQGASQKTGVGFTRTKNLLNREQGRGIDWVFTNHLADLV